MAFIAVNYHILILSEKSSEVENQRYVKNFLTFIPNERIISYYRREESIMDEEVAYFDREELAYISKILRGAFDIRTAANEDDDVLADFIQALDDGATITANEGE